MKGKNLLGFEVGTGEPVYVPLHHLIVTGQTRLSGKTTTLEGLVARSGLKAITFRTKRGEIGFESANRLPLYFNDKGLADWKTLEGLIESTLIEKVRFEPGLRGQIIKVTQHAGSLEEVYQNVVSKQADPKVRGFVADVLVKLQAYLDIVMPQIRTLQYTRTLQLTEGANMMDLTGLTDEMQFLVMHSVMREIIVNGDNTIIVVPEAWKSLSQDRGTPVKGMAERIIREGGSVGVFLFIDSQDLRGVDKKYLRSIDNWILGRQRDPHEVEATLKAIPLPKHLKPKPEEIQQLEIGHFYACLHNEVRRVYVMPTWAFEHEAKAVALGTLSLEKMQVLHSVMVPRPLGGQEMNAHTPQQGLEEQEKQDEQDAHEVALTPVSELALDHKQLVVRVSHSEKLVNMTTGTGLGAILYVLLQGVPASESEVSALLAEHGRPQAHPTLAPNLAKLVKLGLVVREGERPIRFRLPRFVKYNIAEEIPV